MHEPQELHLGRAPLLPGYVQDGEDFPSEHPKVIANSGLEGRSLLLAERLSGRGVEDKSLTSI